jgi:hypothetical protein
MAGWRVEECAICGEETTDFVVSRGWPVHRDGRRCDAIALAHDAAEFIDHSLPFDWGDGLQLKCHLRLGPDGRQHYLWECTFTDIDDSKRSIVQRVGEPTGEFLLRVAGVPLND